MNAYAHSLRVVLGILSVALVAGGCAPAAAPQSGPSTPVASAPASAAPTAAPRPTPELAIATPRSIVPTPAPPSTPAPQTEQVRYGGVLTAYASADAVSMDPHQETSMRTLEKTSAIYNKLVMWDQLRLPEQVVVGDLAETWTMSKDGLEVVFNLRPGTVRWHDGKPLTAEDVKFSFDRLRNPPEGNKKPLLEVYARIADVQVSGEKTVTFKLRQATPWFINLLVAPTSPVMPKHILEKNQKALEGDALGSGPYRLKSWTRGVGFDLEKNRGYFKQGLPYLDGVKWFQIPDAGTQFAAFRAGRVIFTGAGARGLSPSEERILLKDMSGVQLHHYATDTRFDIMFNTQREPFNDVRVRQAFMMVIDQKKAIDLGYEGAGFRGWYARAEWSLPEAELLKLPPVRGVTEEDIQKAKNLLAQAGIRQGTAITFSQGRAPTYEEQQLAVSAQLRLLGIQPNVRTLVYPAETNAAVRTGDYQMLHTSFTYPITDPDSVFAPFLSNASLYFSGLKDVQVDNLYLKQSRALDPVERKKIVDDLQRRLTELAPSVPLLYPRYTLGAWPNVRNVPKIALVKDSWDFEKVWLAPR